MKEWTRRQQVTIDVAVVCREGDWPCRQWPDMNDTTLRVRWIRPPCSTFECASCDVVVLRCHDPVRELPRLHEAMGERSLPVLLVCPTADAEQVITALNLGVVGYLVDEDLCSRALTVATENVVQGHTCFSPAAADALIKSIPPAAGPGEGAVVGLREKLSPREQEVMDLLASGVGVTEIGQRLALTRKTVRNYLSSIYCKLGISNRTAAVLLWLRAD
ncbi:response regulator transcription factor [Streptomyces sp. S3(2020)]|uniref:helix-turn-helix transcriptional regulator n=1 Tax=Streptomyces sp. S3(2020) TaxID=2732044 RepID=UPI00148853A2|nr:response regulator transcription factor [Streptomyces sp. S3(2020)]NNN29182.1 response regulator transcription factor [Streptomyces sp. S3(2020)]